MEVLRFDSRFPSSKYAGWVTELTDILMNAPVICRDSVAATFGGVSNLLVPSAAECAVKDGLARAAAA